MEREAVWKDNWFGWMGRFINLANAITGADEAMFRQITGEKAGTFRQSLMQTRDRELARMRLLICDLAIRAYSLEHGRNPAKLADLVPGYLPEAPKDPFSGGQLVYRVTPTGYLLYSVGVDGVDSGGKNLGGSWIEKGGDILLDDPPAAAIPPQPPGSSSAPVSGSPGR